MESACLSCVFWVFDFDVQLNYILLQDQMNIETKIRNIRFIGELCKFKIAPSGLVFSCLKVISVIRKI